MPTRKEQIKALWKAVFDDSDDFISLFFDHIYREENALTIEKDGEVLSALQLLPYTMNYWGQEVPVAYICGVCTKPAERRKGLMPRLMDTAFSEMRRRGVAVSALIPAENWLFAYYRKMGYTEAFHYALTVYSRDEYFPPKPVCEIREADASAYAYFSGGLARRPLGLLHSEEDFRHILTDLKQEGGQCLLASRADGQARGLAFARPLEQGAAGVNAVQLMDFFYEDEAVKRQLLYAAAQRFGAGKVVYRRPCTPGCMAYTYGMARVMDAERLIPLWKAAHPDDPMKEDELRQMSPAQRSARLLDCDEHAAYMSLMLD
ncbi:MAG: GNAT family N-acetyltransferase [Tannerella sp.]|nr:GNAT family N-acetyltransferase [Tannerella sp.]